MPAGLLDPESFLDEAAVAVEAEVVAGVPQHLDHGGAGWQNKSTQDIISGGREWGEGERHNLENFI